MWKRFVLWLKRLFSSDDSPDSETTAEEMTSTVEKLDVVSCEVVSIAFEEEDEKEEDSEKKEEKLKKVRKAVKKASVTTR